MEKLPFGEAEKNKFFPIRIKFELQIFLTSISILVLRGCFLFELDV